MLPVNASGREAAGGLAAVLGGDLWIRRTVSSEGLCGHANNAMCRPGSEMPGADQWGLRAGRPVRIWEEIPQQRGKVFVWQRVAPKSAEERTQLLTDGVKGTLTTMSRLVGGLWVTRM